MSCRHLRRAGIRRRTCLDCHLARIALERRVRAWIDRWGPGLLLTLGTAAAIVGGALGGAWLRTRW